MDYVNYMKRFTSFESLLCEGCQCDSEYCVEGNHKFMGVTMNDVMYNDIINYLQTNNMQHMIDNEPDRYFPFLRKCERKSDTILYTTDRDITSYYCCSEKKIKGYALYTRCAKCFANYKVVIDAVSNINLSCTKSNKPPRHICDRVGMIMFLDLCDISYQQKEDILMYLFPSHTKSAANV